MKLRRAAFLAFLIIVSASTGPAAARDICDIAADEIARTPPDRIPLGGNDAFVKEMNFDELSKLIPQMEFFSDPRTQYWLGRFDFDGDGVPDFILRQQDGYPAEWALTYRVFKGIAGQATAGKKLMKREIDWGRSDDQWFTTIGNRIYFVQKTHAHDSGATTYTVMPLPNAKNQVACWITTKRPIMPNNIHSECSNSPACKAVIKAAPELIEHPERMLAGTATDQEACPNGDLSGAWRIDMDNDGREEVYLRMATDDGGDAKDVFLDAETPPWDECDEYPKGHDISPAQRWGALPGYSLLNFIRVEQRTYFLFIMGDHITIYTVRNGALADVGSVMVDPSDKREIAITSIRRFKTGPQDWMDPYD